MDNPRSPVSCLPPELLIKTFEYLVTRSNPTILLRICHRWADIASSIPSLWTRIDFLSPPAPSLQRCVNRPIEVILSSYPGDPTSKELRALRKVLILSNDRIHKLALDLPEHHLRAIKPELSGVFPILVDVSISVRQCQYESRRREDIPEWNPVTVPPSSIRCLRLLSVKTPWILGRFQNLVEFFLHEQLDSDINPTMEIFLGILDSSPQLTVLSVAGAGPRLPPDTTTLPPATRVIHLHNLKRLYIERGDAHGIGWMLIHLKIPASTNVRIDLSLRGRSVAPLELAFDLALPDHPGLPHLTNLHRCAYLLEYGPKSIITAANFAFSAAWDHDIHKHFDNFMMPFLRRAAAAGVMEDLAIFCPKPRGSPTVFQWDRIFDTLHSLRRLKFQQSVGDPELSVWELLESSSGPALRDLWLSYLVLDGSWEKWTERLVNYCAERDRRGCRLERLLIEIFYYYDPPPDIGLLLAPYVDHFEIRKGDLKCDISDSEFESRQMFKFPRACR